MRLAKFIPAHIEPILSAWESFARTISVGAAMGPLALRDHAEQLLLACARAMQSQEADDQLRRASDGELLRVASKAHALERVNSGFNLLEVVSEYRALRASVVHLWRHDGAQNHASDIEDQMQFDECIDQSMATAIESYTHRIDRSRQMFLAVLGHDLRNPLNSVVMSAQALQRGNGLDAESLALAAQISSSAQAMARMIADLLDFTGAGLGAAMPLCPETVDLAAIAQSVCSEMRAAYPTCLIRLSADGDLAGTWDPARLRQVISNLMGNAVQHGGGGGPVELLLSGHAAQEVMLMVRNVGEPIPPEALPTIFDPLTRASPELRKQRRPGSIGLGLYIARQIVVAHEGAISVRSSAQEGTVFLIRLPRHVGFASEGRLHAPFLGTSLRHAETAAAPSA